MSYNNNNILNDLAERYSSNEVRLLADQKKRNILKDKLTKRIAGDTEIPLPDYKKHYNEVFQDTINERNKYTYEKNILTYTEDAPSFLITGCQGAGSIFGDQAGVAKAMREFCLRNPAENRKGMLLGDNFYSSGVTHENDPLFKKHFYDLYPNLPFFNILGNHDYDFHRGSSKSVHPMQRAMAQVNHTYLEDPFGQYSLEHAKWIMPARYYALNYKNVNFFMLDSNTFCFDIEQCLWLENTYKTLNPEGSKKWNILVMHHPLVSYGKRHPASRKSDIDWYWLDEYRQLNYNFLSLPDSTMNQWIFEKLANLNLEFDLQLCAHDHFLGFSKIENSPYNKLNTPYWKSNPFKIKKTMYQALVGGGGAFPHGLTHKENALWAEEHLGFLDLNIGENVINLNFHHTSRLWNHWTEKKLNILKNDSTNNRTLQHF